MRTIVGQYVGSTSTLKVKVTVMVFMQPGYGEVCPIRFVVNLEAKILSGCASPGDASKPEGVDEPSRTICSQSWSVYVPNDRETLGEDCGLAWLIKENLKLYETPPRSPRTVPARAVFETDATSRPDD